MSYIERQEFYKQIEKKRGRPLITYVTSLRSNAGASMAQDVISELAKVLKKVPKNVENIDFLIVSNGGDPIVSWRIICMLRERFNKIGVLLPYVAYSAATLLALGADEIIMHKFSNLGPVDPQLIHRKKGPDGNFEQINFGAEDIKYFMEFVCKDVGITDQEQKQKSFDILCKEVGSLPIGTAKRSSHLSVSMGEKLLSMHLDDKNKAKTIAETLNSSYYNHSYALSRSEAIKIDLPVVTPDEDLEDLMWQVWEDVENEMKCREPFNPINVIAESNQAHKLFSPVPNVTVPAGLPPQFTQQLINQALSAVDPITFIEPIDYEILYAILENTTCKSEVRINGKISASRGIDMNLSVNDIKFPKGWTFYDDNV